ncbi:MAG: hypothetical protein M9921_09405 [Fimbriimonadaceae bacterium]|nr:hypothetical protein [Fimbriimonadaceae bacterium]
MLDQELHDRILQAWSVFETPTIRDVHGDPPYDYMAAEMIREINDRPFDRLNCEELGRIHPPLEEIEQFQYKWYYFGGLMLCYLRDWYSEVICTDYIVDRLFLYTADLDKNQGYRKYVTVAQLEVSVDVLECALRLPENRRPSDLERVRATIERLIRLIGVGDSGLFREGK